MSTIFSSGQVELLVRDVAKRIAADFPHGVVLAPVLRGGLIFAADLARYLPGDVRLAPVLARRTVRATLGQPEEVSVALLYPDDYAGRDVVLVEGVINTGRTVEAVRLALAATGSRTISAACLLWKREKTTRPNCTPEYCGRVIGDLHVYGYGMDENGMDRQLPYIACVDETETNELR